VGVSAAPAAGRSERTRGRPRSHRPLQLALLLAGAGALVILLHLFGTGVAVAGLVAIVIGTIVSAPYAPPPSEPGRGWWALLAAGALISVVAAPLALVAETAGGLLGVLGGVMVAIAVALGFPFAER
jgi:hypothetical protein